MKKLFSLVMFALLAVGANAQTWTASATAPDAGTALIDNDLVKVETVSATKTGDFKYTFDDIAFTKYIQVRTNGDANESAPTGGVQSDNTALVVTAHKNINVTFYFRRQKGSNGYDKDDNKDMLCYAQNGKSYESEESVFQSDDSYGYVKKTYSFVEDGIYTIYRSGSTLQVGGFVVSELATDPAKAPTFDPQGGDVTAFSKITLSSDGTVYYQWKDSETTLTKDSEGWTAGSTVEVPNVTATKYLYAYATNGDGLESDVVSQVYNISEVTITAETNKTWDFTNKTNWPNQKLESMFYNDNLIINANSEKTVEITANGLSMGGSPSAADNRTINIKVAPRTCIKVSYASGNATSIRYLNIDKDVYGTNIAKTATDAGNTVITEINHTGKEDATLIIYGTGGGIYISKIVVEPMPTTDTKEVTSNGWATYIPVLDAQFEDGDAYVITDVTDEAVIIENVTEVPANTAVLLKGEGEKTITFVESATKPEKNLLEVYSEDKSDKVAYVLAKDEVNGAGFKKWAGEADLTGRAVLWLDNETATARGFLALDGETTGIETVAPAATQDGAVYDLQGRRVAQPKSGLYILNGKKVVVK